MSNSTFSFLLVCVLLSLTIVNAQFGLTSPKPRTTGEQQFNPNNKGAQALDDYCASGSILTSVPSSTLLFGTPSNYINTQSNNLTPGPGARVVISLIVYQQNGTSFNPNNNVTTPIFFKRDVFVLTNETATLKSGNGNTYTTQLALDATHQCGSPSLVNPSYTQTRCVLRWVYDNTPNGQNSRVSCADVIVTSRATDVSVTLQVLLGPGEVPIASDAALNRLLKSPWATNPDLKFDLFSLPNSDDRNSNQIRLGAVPIVQTGGTYTMNFVISDTVAFPASVLAASLKAQDLSAMFDLVVTDTSTVTLGAASNIHVQFITVILAFALSIVLAYQL